MITAHQPGDWRDLQNSVARILRECGFTVEIEKKIPMVRGQAEIDVYAEESVKGRRHVLIGECKHWKARVPQQVVHAFRTLVADSGGNVGYIISSSGFQAGALTAAELTNVRLVTWEEFQLEFEEGWLENYFVPTVTERLDPLLTYTEPFVPKAYHDLTAEGKNRYNALHDKYAELGWLMMQFTTYSRVFIKKRLPIPPLRNYWAELAVSDRIPSEILDAPAYRQFLEAAIAYGDEAVAEFRKVLGRDAA
jgi:restriction system protein